MMTTAETLRAARTLIERGWCKRARARDAAGKAVRPTSRTAVRWCAAGAVRKVIRARQVYSDLNDDIYYLMVRAGDGIPDVYNDSLPDQAAALAWFDRAIALAEAQP